MFEVYSTLTGRVVRKVRDVVKANDLAISWTETYSWIDRQKFDWRPTDDNSRGSFKGIRRQAGGVHTRG